MSGAIQNIYTTETKTKMEDTDKHVVIFISVKSTSHVLDNLDNVHYIMKSLNILKG